MVDQAPSIFADPTLIRIALCVGAIWVLRWTEMTKGAEHKSNLGRQLRRERRAAGGERATSYR